MKKFLILAAAACLLLSACGQAAPAAEPSPGQSEAAETAGILSDFSTTDLDGSAADESIFAEYKLTMVNIWATFCGPCLQEMPDLGALHQEYQDQGFQIVGIVTDVLNQDGSISESQVEVAKEIGISQAQVSRLEKGAIEQIKKNLS